MIHEAMIWLVETINAWGYVGIGVLMMMESTVLPVPSELVLVPAGYLAHQGTMNIWAILFWSTLGSWCGASFNYFVSQKLGRPFLEKYGKYFFINLKSLQKTDVFFQKHGSFSTFTGRLIPVIRHFISIPAGLTSMPFSLFSFYTILGAFIWSAVLVGLGYAIGDNKNALAELLPFITAAVVFVVIVLWIFYFFLWKTKNSGKE